MDFIENERTINDGLAVYAHNVYKDELSEAFRRADGDGSFINPIIFNDDFYGKDRTRSEANNIIDKYVALHSICIFWKAMPTSDHINVTVATDKGIPVTLSIVSSDQISGVIRCLDREMNIPKYFEADLISALIRILKSLGYLGYKGLICNTTYQESKTFRVGVAPEA